MGENALALVLYLSSPESPLPSLTEGYTKPTTVYYSHLGKFWVYSFTTANIMHGLFLVATLAVSYQIPDLLTGLLANIAGFFGSIISANTVAFVMCKVLGKSMSWFSHEWLALGLFGPPALLGALASQLLFKKKVERASYHAVLLLQAVAASGLQLVGIGSAALFFISAAPQLVALLLNPLFGDKSTSAERQKEEISLVTYGLGQFLPLMTGALVYFPVMEVFVPLVCLASPFLLSLPSSGTDEFCTTLDGKSRGCPSG
jgi:hypothetical protein